MSIKTGKIIRGTLIAAAAAALTYLSELKWDLGAYTPIVVAGFAVLINMLKVARAKL